jgi:hypothetical protein
MVEMLQPTPYPTFNTEHPTIIEAKKNNLEIIDYTLETITPEIRHQLNQICQGEEFKKHVYIHEKRKPPAYHVCSITEKNVKVENNQPSDITVIFMPGINASAAMATEVGVPLYTALTDSKNLKISKNHTVHVMSSSTSMDVAATKLPYSSLERACYQASAIIDILRKYPSKRIILAGTSGGSEFVFTLPLVERLLKKNNINSEISGIILTQPASMYDQSTLNFVLKKFPKSFQFKAEIHELFPTKEDIIDLKLAHEKCVISHDEEGQKALEKIIVQEQQRLQNRSSLIYLTDDEKNQLNEFEIQIDKARNEKDIKRVKKTIKKRDEMLIPVIGRLNSGPEMRPSKLKSMIRICMDLRKYTHTIPEWVRSLIHSNVCLVWSEKDVFFPECEAHESLIVPSSKEEPHMLISEKKQTEYYNSPTNTLSSYNNRIFPNASRYMYATMLFHGHQLAVNTKRYASMITEIIENMIENTLNKNNGAQPLVEHYTF